MYFCYYNSTTGNCNRSNTLNHHTIVAGRASVCWILGEEQLDIDDRYDRRVQPLSRRGVRPIEQLAGAMRTFLDADFGAIHDYGDGMGWTLERRASFGIGAVPVRVESEGATFHLSPLQREAIRLIFALTIDSLADSAPAVVQNYSVYQDMLWDELPTLRVPADVWQQVQPTYFLVPIHDGVTVPTFLLFAECDWDPEHGLTVRFRNGRADESNQQGEIGIRD
jgi:hypothetical protein